MHLFKELKHKIYFESYFHSENSRLLNVHLDSGRFGTFLKKETEASTSGSFGGNWTDSGDVSFFLNLETTFPYNV